LFDSRQITYKKRNNEKAKHHDDRARLMKTELVNRTRLVSGVIKIVSVDMRENGERSQERKHHDKTNQENR